MEAKRRLAAQELSSRAEEETIRASESGFTLLSMLQMDTEDLATAWLILGCQAMRPVLWSCSQRQLMPASLLGWMLVWQQQRNTFSMGDPSSVLLSLTG